jgi:D-tyrosyl-tRNA(Tyr) deacylase
LVGHFGEALHSLGLPVATDRFGAEMQVALVNDGPVTIWLNSADLRR